MRRPSPGSCGRQLSGWEAEQRPWLTFISISVSLTAYVLRLLLFILIIRKRSEDLERRLDFFFTICVNLAVGMPDASWRELHDRSRVAL